MLKKYLLDKYIKNEPAVNPQPNDKILFISNVIVCSLGMFLSIIAEIILIVLCFKFYDPKTLQSMLFNFVTFSIIIFMFFYIGLVILENAYKSYHNKKR